MVLDPFCGCGTAVAAAEKLGRNWIGIDITHLAVALMKNRLKTMFQLIPGKDYAVVGEPLDTGSATALAEQDRYQFQYWAMSLLEALPRENKKKGADRGIDGLVYFIDGPASGNAKSGGSGEKRPRVFAADPRLEGCVGAGKSSPGPVYHVAGTYP